MPRLIHLNGPSRVGKSTLALRYADEHPGCLRVDLDVLTGLVGGWRDDFSAAWATARLLGWAMAAQHLRDGHDVVVPQLVTAHDTSHPLDAVARGVGATYVEVALLVDPAEHARRVRGKRPAHEVEAAIQTLLEDPDADLVAKIRRHLAEYLADRPATHRLDTTGLDEAATYERLLGVVATA